MSKGKQEYSIEKRILLLENFKITLKQWDEGDFTEQSQDELRSTINRNLVAVQATLREAGISVLMSITPPPAVGGYVQTIDMLENVFKDFWRMSLIPDIVDRIEQAIGVYEHVRDGHDLLPSNIQQAIDVEAAIERALRPSFSDSEPQNEREVQDHVETILNALGVEFTREQETAPVGGKAYKPDFVLPNMDLAVEVKLANKSHKVAMIQEELNADISAYSTKWARLLVVIYDMGVIKDPHGLRKSNQKLFGVSVVVIKH